MKLFNFVGNLLEASTGTGEWKVMGIKKHAKLVDNFGDKFTGTLRIWTKMPQGLIGYHVVVDNQFKDAELDLQGSKFLKSAQEHAEELLGMKIRGRLTTNPVYPNKELERKLGHLGFNDEGTESYISAKYQLSPEGEAAVKKLKAK